MITEVYVVLGQTSETFIFATRELAVQSIRLSFHKIAKTVPNVALTHCTIVWDDKTREHGKIYIKPQRVWNEITHL